jgi:hypothetical protein
MFFNPDFDICFEGNALRKIGSNFFLHKMTGSCIAIENEISNTPGGDPNSEADKSLIMTGQKMVSNLTTTGQKMEMYPKPL